MNSTREVFKRIHHFISIAHKMWSSCVILVLLLYTSSTMVNFVACQRPSTPNCLKANPMTTNGQQTSIFTETSETLVQFDRKNQPTDFGFSTSIEDDLHLSKLNFGLSTECQKQIVHKEWKGFRFTDGSKHIYINGRFTTSGGCIPIVDGIFEYKLGFKCTHVGTTENQQLLAYGSKLGVGFVSISRNLVTDTIQETRSLITNQTFPNLTTSLPSSMSLLSFDQTQDTIKMLYVYDDLLYTIVDIDSQQQIIPSKIDTLWFSANKLIGCSPNLCLDGQLDSVHHHSGKFSLNSGFYRWEVDELSKDTQLQSPIHMSRKNIISASFVAGPFENVKPFTVLLVNNLLNYDGKGYNLKQIFANSSEQVAEIDAAFSFDDGNVFFIIGQQIHKYHLNFDNQSSPTLRATYDGGESVSDRWHGVPEVIDTAMVVDGQVYLTSNSFYVTVPLNGGEASERKLIQNNWFKCEDDQYQPMARTWGVNNFEQFQNFKFRRVPHQDTKRSTFPTLIAIISVVALVVILVIIGGLILAVIWKRNHSRRNTSLDSVPPVTSEIGGRQNAYDNSTVGRTAQESNTYGSNGIKPNK